MELVSTPEPHFIPGYTGHCPQYIYRVGKTYGNLTHKLLIDPCVYHSPKLLVASPHEVQNAEDRPTLKEIDLIKTRERESEPVVKYPIIPGYDGFIPNIQSKIGDRFLAAATAGVAEHEKLMQQLRCERRNLKNKDLLQNGNGLAPLQKADEGITSSRVFPDTVSNVPYSKHTPPHFMVDKDPEKYIIKGYAGHIPMSLKRFGESNKELTANALGEFSNNYKHRRSAEWAPISNAGVGSSLPSGQSFKIYHRTTGMIPSYAGHVPGEIFKFGSTYGKNTVDAKRWLDEHL